MTILAREATLSEMLFSSLSILNYFKRKDPVSKVLPFGLDLFFMWLGLQKSQKTSPLKKKAYKFVNFL